MYTPYYSKDSGLTFSGDAHKGSLAIYANIFWRVHRHKYISALHKSKWIRLVYTYVDCKFRRKEKRGARIIPGFSWKKMTEERSKLIEDNLMFAYSMANKFCGVPIEYDDLIGIANYGLVKAAQKSIMEPVTVLQLMQEK